jgi:hypothetical protein
MRVGGRVMVETYFCTLAYAAPFYAGWTLLDMYRIDPEYFWERITFGAFPHKVS